MNQEAFRLSAVRTRPPRAPWGTASLTASWASSWVQVSAFSWGLQLGSQGAYHLKDARHEWRETVNSLQGRAFHNKTLAQGSTQRSSTPSRHSQALRAVRVRPAQAQQHPPRLGVSAAVAPLALLCAHVRKNNIVCCQCTQTTRCNYCSLYSAQACVSATLVLTRHALP